MFEYCLGIIVFCVLIPEVELPPQDPGASGPDFWSSEPLGEEDEALRTRCDGGLRLYAQPGSTPTGVVKASLGGCNHVCSSTRWHRAPRGAPPLLEQESQSEPSVQCQTKIRF